VYSDDHGATWKLGASDTRDIADPQHPNESVVIELADGRIYDNARDQDGSDPATRVIAFSSNGGESFDHPFIAEPAITAPVVQNSAIRLAAKDQGDSENLLVYCGPGDAKQRRDLTLLVSDDEAKSWGRKTVIHSGPAAYSDLVKLDDRKVGVLYEAGKKLYGEIVFQVVNVDDLAPGAK
jgi:sialidase-1